MIYSVCKGLIGVYLIFILFFFPKDLSTNASTMEPAPSTQESTTSNQPAASSTKESTISNEPERMPAFFIGHGGPTLVAEKGPYIDYLKGFRKTIPKPEAIIIFSAHWEESTQTIGYVVNPFITILSEKTSAKTIFVFCLAFFGLQKFVSSSAFFVSQDLDFDPKVCFTKINRASQSFFIVSDSVVKWCHLKFMKKVSPKIF